MCVETGHNVGLDQKRRRLDFFVFKHLALTVECECIRFPSSMFDFIDYISPNLWWPWLWDEGGATSF